MTTSLARFQRPSVRDKLEASVGHVKSVTELLGDIGEALEKLDEKHDIGSVISAVLPWVTDIAEAASEAFPIVKFVAKLLGKRLAQPDPHVLAYLACTLAYQRSIEQALRMIGRPAATPRSDEIKREMKAAYKALDTLSFHNLALDAATEHPFVQQADGFFDIFARSAGFDEAQRRQLLNAIRSTFTENLKTLLSHGDTRERFTPLRELMALDTTERLAYEALYRHGEYQQWLYARAPTLGGEPFALGHVYVETDCGKLTWGQLRSARESADLRGAMGRPSMDPFEETSSPRAPVLQTIMDLLGDPEFNDAIVVQGVAGSGKSALTLRLCAELNKEGLRPIRVRMRDLRFDRHANEAIPDAVMLADATASSDLPRPEDLFLGGRIFNQRVRFRGAQVCPFVLILDGWDEISISTREGFEFRLERLLDQVRNEYLRAGRGHLVRVIITGRPTAALAQSTFLRDATAILTLRSLMPGQIETLVAKLAQALGQRPLLPGSAPSWSIPDVGRFRKVLDRYTRDFEAARERERKGQHQPVSETGGSMEVLGHPLLAQIAVRLMAQWDGDLENLIENPTTLYRSLVDLTCAKGGQIEDEPLDLADRHRVRGPALRDLLRKTAVAMTTFGAESIKYDELEERLSLDPGELTNHADKATRGKALSALLISFYFKDGMTHLGCEFMHKTFREYLFAEALVEMLKDYGRETDPSGGAEHPLALRKPYWKDFDSDDPRYRLSRALGPALSSQWMSREIAAHVKELLTWEIGRAAGVIPDTKQGQPTARLSLEGWERARDGLADLWDSWGEGVHLRPQPHWNRNNLELDRSYADVLVEDALPKALRKNEIPAPRRTITADAHLGDGLFHLTSIVHREIATVTGWMARSADAQGRWEGAGVETRDSRPCQSVIKEEGRHWVLFTPAGHGPGYLLNYCARINAAGWRPGGLFPVRAELGALDLEGTNLVGILGGADFSLANMAGTGLVSAYMARARLSGIFGNGLRVYWSMLEGAHLDGAFLARTAMNGSHFVGASFERTDLRGAIFDQCDLRGARFKNANLQNARLYHCQMDDADFENADVEGMIALDCNLANARLDPEQRARIQAATALALKQSAIRRTPIEERS